MLFVPDVARILTDACKDVATDTGASIARELTPGMDVSADFLDGLFALRAMSMVASVVLVYDFFLTISEEVKYIWRSRWSMVKALFLFTRYVNLFAVTAMTAQTMGWWRGYGNNARHFCAFFLEFQSVLVFVSSVALHTLVLQRVWVLYQRRRWILVTLMVLFAQYACICLIIYLYYIFAIGMEQYFIVPDIIGTCLAFKSGDSWVIWMPNLIMEAIALVFTFKAFNSLNLHMSNPLVVPIYVGGAAYSTIAIFNGVSNAIMWKLHGDSALGSLFSNIGLALTTAAAQRMVLVLRAVSSTPVVRSANRRRAHDAVQRAIDLLNDDTVSAVAAIVYCASGGLPGASEEVRHISGHVVHPDAPRWESREELEALGFLGGTTGTFEMQTR